MSGEEGDAVDDAFLFDAAPCGYVCLNLDGTVSKVNQTFLDLTGHTRDALAGGRRFTELLTGGGRIYYETHLIPMLRMQQSARAIALDLVCADGSRRPVLVNAVLDTAPTDTAVRIRLVTFDATERRTYEQELLAAKQRAEGAEADLRAQAAELAAAVRAKDLAAREVRQLAEALQQALLTPPPKPDHLHIVVRYRPAAHEAQVGGDWYDAFIHPDGATVVTIGDVMGHDGFAAAKMGQLRGLLRALAFDAGGSGAPESPAAILTRVEHAARGLAVDALATAVLARIERVPDEPLSSRRIVRWANAGHPPPVLVHVDGTVELLDAKPDLLLGVDATAPRRDHTTELPPGSTLLLYTDGLIERRTWSLDDGLARLREVLEQVGDVTTDELCDSLLARLAPEAGDDDIALIAVRAVLKTPDRTLQVCEFG